MGTNELSVSVRLTREQHRWLSDAAEEVEESMSWVLRDLISQAMAEEEGDE